MAKKLKKSKPLPRSSQRQQPTKKNRYLPAAILTSLVFLGMLADVAHQLVYPHTSLAQSNCSVEQAINLSVTDSNPIQEIVFSLPSCMSGTATVSVRGYEGHSGDGCTQSSAFGSTCQGRESARFDLAPKNTVYLPAGEYVDQGKLYRTFQVQSLISQSRSGEAQFSIRYTGKPYNNDSSIPTQRNSVNITSVRVDKGDTRSQSSSPIPTPSSTASPSLNSQSPSPSPTAQPTPSDVGGPSGSSGNSTPITGNSGNTGNSNGNSNPSDGTNGSSNSNSGNSGSSNSNGNTNTPQATPWTYAFLETKCQM
ncbi:hypothetical protein KBD71_05145 [Candidatus Woesebacteria bacterium]|nr:hypothetical protein [Candidatus Woesebacteria bacterium]